MSCSSRDSIISVILQMDLYRNSVRGRARISRTHEHACGDSIESATTIRISEISVQCTVVQILSTVTHSVSTDEPIDASRFPHSTSYRHSMYPYIRQVVHSLISQSIDWYSRCTPIHLNAVPVVDPGAGTRVISTNSGSVQISVVSTNLPTTVL